MLSSVASIIALIGTFNVRSSERPVYDWYVVTEALNERHQSLNIGEGEHRIDLRNGWACRVGVASVNNARQVSCSFGDHAFEFSVQCDASRPRDHTQIRFRPSGRRAADFIEVGCKAREGGP